MTGITPSPLNNVITIDDERIKNHLDRIVRGSVEETLNASLTPKPTGYAIRSATSQRGASGYTRGPLLAPAVNQKPARCGLKVPKLRAQTFETAVSERYRRRESSVEEALTRCIWPRVGFAQQ